jgi:3'(2'), 5'-bisphosphate nucleotidase
MAFGQNNHRKLIIEALQDAGQAISAIEAGAYKISHKDDSSPLTDADLISDSIIRKALSNLSPDIPVVSEEQEVKTESIELPGKFWLLDPLDGTKEFIKGNGEYCISLALIISGRPVEGYIYSPVQKVLWYAIKGQGAFRLENTAKVRLPSLGSKEEKSWLLLRSRSHHNNKEETWYKKASENREIIINYQGSAIKFCRIAEGSADLYVKKGRIFGWDIAAGDLILEESGGKLAAYGNDREISYKFDKAEMPFFVACGHRVVNPENWLF